MWPKRTSLTQTQTLTLLLVMTSALAARLAITEPGTAWYGPLLTIVAYAVCAVVLAVLDRRGGWFTRSSSGAARLTWAGIVAGLLLLGAPFAESVSRILSTTHFRPLEQVTIVSLTNFAFFAVAVVRVRRSSAAAAGVSFVLLLAALMLGGHSAIFPLSAAYGGLCVAWLATRHWRGVTTATRNGGAARYPLAPVLGLMLLLAGVTAASTRLAQGMPEIWGEWMPSSGGSRWLNPDALLGVGDGDWVVSGPNAKSTGSIDSDYFLESDLPTLYDVMMETYGEPRLPKDVLRAIFVEQEQMLSRQGHKAPDMGTAGREFSLYRKERTQRQAAAEAADALLYVEGRVPLHLAMTVYERFDGVAWQEPRERNDICRLEAHEPDVSWLWLPRRENEEIFGGTRRHQLRFGRFTSDRLPLPNHMQRFRFGRKDSDNVKRWALDILTWAHDGILRARQCLPSGTYVEVSSHAVDQAVLLRSSHLVGEGVAGDPCLSLPDHLRRSTEALAARFADHPRGWEQVEAVLNHLRTHYAHDRDATIPPTCTDPIHHFLHHAQGGPSYQFATAATLALRSLGYPTRVVSGFYVDPADYVARAGNTPIRADDAHFWIEVRTARGAWITFDPTPGYPTEWYEPTWMQRVQRVAASLGQLLAANPVVSVIGLVLSIGLWWRRLWLRERLLTLWCLWWPMMSPHRRLADTLRLLDLRSGLYGTERPPAKTPLAWYGGVDHPACRAFVWCLYAALYGGGRGGVAVELSEVERACRAAVKATGRERLRELGCGS